MSSRIPAYRPLAGGREPDDLSHPALAIARLVDRLCRAPGQYALLVTVPTHRRAPWIVEFYRMDKFYSGEARL